MPERVRDYHQAKVSNNQNEVMKRLTVIALPLSSPSFIVRFYGMSTRGEPEYRWRRCYGRVLGLLVGATVLQLSWFCLKRWT